MNFLNNILKHITGKEDKDYLQEGAKEEKELLDVSMSEEKLLSEIDKDIQTAKPLYEAMKKIQEDNERYYLGEQLDQSRFSWELPNAENLLYAATETVISILTGRKKEPIVMASQETDESKKLAQETQQFLVWKWHDEDGDIKFEDWIRHATLYRIGVLKIRFDPERDDFEILNIRPQRIMVDRDATDEYNAKFIIELKQDTLSELASLFPAAKDKLKQAFGEQEGTLINYIEYWTNEFTVWKVNKILLAKKKNPNWNWDEKDRKKNLKKLREKWTDKTKQEKLKNILLNYFNEPRKPYIILSLKSLNKDIYGDTSDFEQSKNIQDIINKRKRQIDKAGQRALGREVYSGSFIGKAEAKKSYANPNAPVWIERGKASDAVTHIAPQQPSSVLFQDLQESKLALDDLMGTHSTTRGERGGQETATGRKILKEGDYGRIDLMGKRIDKKLELLFAWMMQMVKVYYTEQHYIKFLGKERANTYLQFSSDNVEDGQEVIVKSELTTDKATQKENAISQLQLKLNDPLSTFEALDIPNPKERARRLLFYLVDPKLYISQFLIDENAEGAENNPAMKAKQEQEQITRKEQVPPFQNADKEHLEEHIKFAKSGEFQNLDVEIQQSFRDHLAAEMETLRKSTKV